MILSNVTNWALVKCRMMYDLFTSIFINWNPPLVAGNSDSFGSVEGGRGKCWSLVGWLLAGRYPRHNPGAAAAAAIAVVSLLVPCSLLALFHGVGGSLGYEPMVPRRQL